MGLFKHWKEAEARAKEIKTEVDSLNIQIDETKTAIADRNIDTELRESHLASLSEHVERCNSLQSEYEKVIARREELRTIENEQVGLASAVNSLKIASRVSMTSDDVYSSRSYALAWTKYVRTGDDAEVRQLISTVDSSAGEIVTPKILVNRIEEVMRTGGRILNLCRLEQFEGMTEHPVSVESSDPDWHKETGGAPKGDKSLKMVSVKIDPEFIADVLPITKKFEALSLSAFWEWLKAELPDALKRRIDTAILLGVQDGTEGIRGIITNVDPIFVKQVDGGIIDFNVVNEAVGELADGVVDNITVVMNRKTFFKNIRGLKGADGHPIWTSSADEEKAKFFLSGFPVTFSSKLPAFDVATDNAPYMIVGDFKAMLLNFPKGMTPRVTRDELTRKKDNIVEYLPEILVGGNITRPGSFVVVRKSGTVPIGGASGSIDIGTLQAEIDFMKTELEAAKAEVAKAYAEAEAAKAEVAKAYAEAEAAKATTTAKK
jgi:HK97 family phage major capsid protein